MTREQTQEGLQTAIQLIRSGNHEQAANHLRTLVERDHSDPQAHYLLGVAQGQSGLDHEAMQSFARATELDPSMTQAWKMLGDVAVRLGQIDEAIEAYRHDPLLQSPHPLLARAEEQLKQERPGQANRLFQEFSDREPGDGRGLLGMARIAISLGANIDAIRLLGEALERSPDLHTARYELVRLLSARQKYQQAFEHIKPLLNTDPDNFSYQLMNAALLDRTGQYAKALAVMKSLAPSDGLVARTACSTSYIQRTLGETDDAVASCLRAIQADPGMGEAWFALANLKNYEFSEQQINAMQDSLSRSHNAQDQYWFHFALANGLEKAGEYSRAFEQYAAGNAIRHQQKPFNGAAHDQVLASWKAACEQADRSSAADSDTDGSQPIFIVGLPRSGTTLVEHILSSHSQVEGLKELPNISTLVSGINYTMRKSGRTGYPGAMGELDPEYLKELGREYLADTRIHRVTEAASFTDKMPNNFEHIGLISRILPGAKFIDVRRHPMANGFSAFRQLFNTGQEWSYRLEDIAHYYHNYLEYMTLWDDVLPGRVHHLSYEQLVSDTENEVRQMLEYLDLLFEPSCLAFHQNRRPVKSASSEQVREPVHARALEHWKHFERQLSPMRAAFAELGVDSPG